MSPLSRKLALLSANEMVSALGVGSVPLPLRRGLALPFRALSRRLAETLAVMDDTIAERGLPAAAAQALTSFGVELRESGAAPESKACLVLANHPGAYDALALMSALRRRDLLILAADRVFLRALPNLSQHLLFVGDTPGERAAALKRALLRLRSGGAVLHFPAGQIEPDADFEHAPARLLAPWQPGVAALLKACTKVEGRVIVAGVRGVHSPRAKGFVLNRLAEARGITTLSPLLQMVGRLRDVVARVHCADAGSALAEPAMFRERLRQAILQA